MNRMTGVLVGAFLCLCGPASLATEISAGDLKIDTYRSAAMLKTLSYKGRQLTSGFNSFEDRFARNDGGFCDYESGGCRSEWDLVKLNGRFDAGTADERVANVYAKRLNVFTAFKVTKSFSVYRRRPVLAIDYVVENVSAAPAAFGHSTAFGMLSGEGANTFFQGDPAATWAYPSEAGEDIAVCDAPNVRASGFWSADGVGAVVRWPAGRTTGMTSWQDRKGGRLATLEYFGVSETVPPGGKISFRIEMEFSDDVPALVAKGLPGLGAAKAEPLLWIRKYTRSGGFDPRNVRQLLFAPLAEGAGEADMRSQLEDELNIPISFLETFHDDHVSPHVEWFKPSAPVDVLYLYNPKWNFIANGKRLMIEMKERMNVVWDAVPLLRQPSGANRGQPYAVRELNWEPHTSDWALAKVASLTKGYSVVVVRAVDFAAERPRLAELLRELEQKGSRIVFVDCRNVPGKFRRSTRTRMTGRKIVYGRDYPQYEYDYLEFARILRRAAGGLPAEITSATSNGLQVAVSRPGRYALERRITGVHREEEQAAVREPVALDGKSAWLPFVPPDGLPGGEHVCECRLLDADGRVADAAAFRFATPDTVGLSVAFDRADRIYGRTDEVRLALSARNLPAGATFVTELEDGDFRIVRRATGDRVSFRLPADVTRLCNAIVRVERDGRVLAKRFEEFAVRAPMADMEDTQAYITISPPEPEFQPLLRDCGFDYVISSFSESDWALPYIRQSALLGMQAVPRNCADKKEWFKTYRWTQSVNLPAVRDPCFSSAKFREELRARIRKAAEVCRYDYYGVRLHWLGDEPFLGAPVCFAPDCLAAFRREMLAKYGSVQALNRQWGTSFATEDDVRPCQLAEIRDPSNLGQWLEHKMFMCRQFPKTWIGQAQKELAAVAPGSECGPTGTQPPGHGYDWSQIMKYIGGIGYYAGAQRKCIHDFAALYGRPLLAGECGGGYTHAHWDFEPYNYNTMWSGLLNGSNLAYHYYGAAIEGDASLTSNMVYWVKSLAELKGGIGKLFLSGRAKSKIAVLYSQASLFAAMGTGREQAWQNAQTSWWRLLSDLKFDFTFYPYEMLSEKGVPDGIRAFVLPYALALSRRERERIADFIARGGLVLADVEPGAFDEAGKAAAPLRAGVVLTGKDTCRYSSVSLSGVGGESSSTVRGEQSLTDALQAQVFAALEKAGARPICSVRDSSGKVFCCNAALREDAGNWIFGLHLEAEDPHHKGNRRGSTGGGRFDFSKGERVTAKLPVRGHVYEVRSGTYVGETDTVETSLIPGWTRMYSILRTKPGELSVTGPDAVRPGETAQFRFAAENATGAQVYHVELVDPDGKSAWRFRKNVRTTSEGGYAFETALNEKPGRWTLVVKHVNTGRLRRVGFRVLAFRHL